MLCNANSNNSSCYQASTSKAPDVNYDHINLESPHDFSSGTTPASEPDAVFEDHYAQVRERTYDVVKDVRARTSAKVASSADYDPYAKVILKKIYTNFVSNLFQQLIRDVYK